MRLTLCGASSPSQKPRVSMQKRADTCTHVDVCIEVMQIEKVAELVFVEACVCVCVSYIVVACLAFALDSDRR